MDCFPDVLPPKELSLFTCVISIIISFTAITINTFIIFIVIKDPLKKLHTPFNYFVVNLATSDLILGLVTMPISIYVHYEEYKGFNKIKWMQTLHMTYFISATSSLLSIVILSLDRMIAISYAIKYRKYSRLRLCLIISGGMWAISLSFPLIYFKLDYTGYLMFFAHSAIASGAILLAVYKHASKYLRSHRIKLISHISSSAPARAYEEFELKERRFEKRIGRTLLIMCCAFIGVCTPAVILIYILQFSQCCDCTYRHVLQDLQFILISSNSCMNPLIYLLRIKTIRHSLKIIFCKRLQASVGPISVSTNISIVRQLPQK